MPGSVEARQDLCEALGRRPYEPQVDPAEFVDPDDIGESVDPNPYFPLVPGYEWIYQGETEEGDETTTVTVTDEIKEIEYPYKSGNFFKCRVVTDVVELDGEVIEDTDDWYAQDIDGNVWYFGEISQEFEDGELVGLGGSWKAGVQYAKPGILVWRAPQVRDVYRQEFALGEAEDAAKVLSLKASATVPGASCEGDCLKTKDFSPLEPDVVERKFYKPGVGLILEVTPETGERVELITGPES